VADVALLQDQGDLVVRRNLFDLDHTSLRFTPTPEGHALSRLSIPLDAPGSVLALGHDAAAPINLPWNFSFYGKKYSKAWVHSDGSVTFAAPGTESDRSLGSLLAGPPRIAAFFADLDPSRGGTVSTVLLADRAAFLWSDVPGGAQANRNNFEIVLHPGGEIDLAFGALESREAIVGIAPGAGLDLTVADLSQAHPARASGAVLERFSETEHVDLVSVGRRFYVAHPDSFDQLVVYTTRPLNPQPGSLAFEVNVSNDVMGIGESILDESGNWGSAGALASVVYMDAIDPYLDVDGFEFLAHEVGHRWLARLLFRASDGSTSHALLGRSEVHWSFFLDSDASVLEGNAIADRGDGHFETVDFARRYSPLDQYAMGLRAAGEVDPFYYVSDPDDFHPVRGYTASSEPESGVTFTGQRSEVTIGDVISAMGPRVPSAAAAPRLLRQAYVLVADAVAAATPERLTAVTRIRSHFETYYRQATDGRGVVQTRLPR
jgi:hypothetical protein